MKQHVLTIRYNLPVTASVYRMRLEGKELEEQIFEMIAQLYKKDAEELSLDTTFKDDLGGASVLMVGLVSEIENELDVMIQLQDAAACETIGDLVDKVEEEME